MNLKCWEWHEDYGIAKLFKVSVYGISAFVFLLGHLLRALSIFSSIKHLVLLQAFDGIERTIEPFKAPLWRVCGL